MDLLPQSFEFLLHFDRHLSELVILFGPLVYIFLFLMIVAVTGIVVLPFLPGNSLLFVSGALIGAGILHPIAYLVLLLAAIVGNMLNYMIGFHFGERILTHAPPRFFKKEYLEKTHLFYEKHGNKTVFIARFFAFVRTFAPFVAGVGKMSYVPFVSYSVIGGFIWVSVCVGAGMAVGTQVLGR